MTDEFDFNPDFSEDEREEQNTKITVYPKATAVKNDESAVTINGLVNITKQHIEDDARVRDEIDNITGILDSVTSQMTIRELIEYLKVKIKEREMHVKCIFDAYRFIQQTEIAREMLIGSDRKERVMQSMDNQRMSRVMGFLNVNYGN